MSYWSPKSRARYTDCYLRDASERGEEKVHFEISEQETSWETSILNLVPCLLSLEITEMQTVNTSAPAYLLFGLLIYSIASAFINSFSAVTMRNQSSGRENLEVQTDLLSVWTPFFGVEFNARARMWI